MSLDAFPHRSKRPESVEHPVRGQGGAATITKDLGVGVTLTRTGTGTYRITWSENPGKFLVATYALQAATPANLAGHTVIFDTYDTTNFRLDFSVFNAADAAHDLAANEYIDVVARFATSAVEGA